MSFALFPSQETLRKQTYYFFCIIIILSASFVDETSSIDNDILYLSCVVCKSHVRSIEDILILVGIRKRLLLCYRSLPVNGLLKAILSLEIL